MYQETKKHKPCLLLLIVVLVLLVGVFLYLTGTFRSGAVFVPKLPKREGIFSFSYPSSFNYRQTGTTCGPYSVAAVMRIYGYTDVSSEEIASSISYKIPGYGTHPLGLEEALKKLGLTPAAYRLDQSDMSDRGRAAFLKVKLIGNQPVIILGQKNGVQHYVTILGVNVDTDEFYLYDSWLDEGEPGMTVDENGETPGNVTMTADQVLNFWRGGGLYGFYEWYALVVEITPPKADPPGAGK